MESYRETNKIELCGTVVSKPLYSHKSYGEVFYHMELAIERKSGYSDNIPLIISERLIWDEEIPLGSYVSLIGQIRTYNEVIEGKNKLNIVAFVREFTIEEGESADINRVTLEGYLCKNPVRRVSPLGREICDIMLAVNRMYNKSDYIPCIAWGRNAAYAGGLDVGTRIKVGGRIQSREYKKKNEDGSMIEKIAYEVSIINIEE